MSKQQVHDRQRSESVVEREDHGKANGDGDGVGISSEGSAAASGLQAQPESPHNGDVIDDRRSRLAPTTKAVEIDRAGLSPEVLLMIDGLQAEVDRLKRPRKVASGSKARPNVRYTLLKQPPKWSDTPQVAQLEEILFGQDKREMTEPEIFDLIKRGAEAGILRTKQNPVRIFQYYRSDLIKDNVLIYR